MVATPYAVYVAVRCSVMQCDVAAISRGRDNSTLKLALQHTATHTATRWHPTQRMRQYERYLRDFTATHCKNH